MKPHFLKEHNVGVIFLISAIMLLLVRTLPFYLRIVLHPSNHLAIIGSRSVFDNGTIEAVKSVIFQQNNVTQAHVLVDFVFSIFYELNISIETAFIIITSILSLSIFSFSYILFNKLIAKGRSLYLVAYSLLVIFLPALTIVPQQNISTMLSNLAFFVMIYLSLRFYGEGNVSIMRILIFATEFMLVLILGAASRADFVISPFVICFGFILHSLFDRKIRKGLLLGSIIIILSISLISLSGTGSSTNKYIFENFFAGISSRMFEDLTGEEVMDEKQLMLNGAIIFGSPSEYDYNLALMILDNPDMTIRKMKYQFDIFKSFFVKRNMLVTLFSLLGLLIYVIKEGIKRSKVILLMSFMLPFIFYLIIYIQEFFLAFMYYFICMFVAIAIAFLIKILGAIIFSLTRAILFTNILISLILLVGSYLLIVNSVSEIVEGTRNMKDIAPVFKDIAAYINNIDYLKNSYGPIVIKPNSFGQYIVPYIKKTGSTKNLNNFYVHLMWRNDIIESAIFELNYIDTMNRYNDVKLEQQFFDNDKIYSLYKIEDFIKLDI